MAGLNRSERFYSGLGCIGLIEADIRWLHFFQAWMYIVTIALSLQGNRWGYFVGISTAGFWDYANVFATTFFFNGLEDLSHLVDGRDQEREHLGRHERDRDVPALQREGIHRVPRRVPRQGPRALPCLQPQTGDVNPGQASACP